MKDELDYDLVVSENPDVEISKDAFLKILREMPEPSGDDVYTYEVFLMSDDDTKNWEVFDEWLEPANVDFYSQNELFNDSVRYAIDYYNRMLPKFGGEYYGVFVRLLCQYKSSYEEGDWTDCGCYILSPVDGDVRSGMYEIYSITDPI
jgi:hypothetical protein